jgi:HD-GYP domain-containing protein (c-di-GMP phosphodiesterase class II)/DNA-binding CsgD family transcriptional regulator
VTPAGKSVRLAEILAALSLGSDLGMGLPMEHVLRQCLISMRLADRAGLDATDRSVVYYTALLAWVGCHVDAYEQAKWFGDDLALKADFRTVDFDGPAAVARFMLAHFGAGLPIVDRAKLGTELLRTERPRRRAAWERHCSAANELAGRLGLGERVRGSVVQTFERWDGKGAPAGARGEEILPTARVVNLADVVEVFHRVGGTAAAISVARERSGTQFDPDLVDVFCSTAAEMFAELDAVTTWDAVIADEPGLAAWLSDSEFDSALESIADFVDLKSPYTIGHSRGVAELAAAAARGYGLPSDDTTLVRRAGLVHDLGRLGVSNAIWDKPGKLTAAEFERVRFHPYLSGRILALSDALAPLGALAVEHHERLDGSGYPQGINGNAITLASRILAVADAYRTWVEPRPHRPACPADQAAVQLLGEARAGRLDGGAVDAVLCAAGQHVRRHPQLPAGLTPREIEVLKLVALGLKHSEIAERLVISHKTARHHVEHIYGKIGVSNRAMACLYATRHGLIGDF